MKPFYHRHIAVPAILFAACLAGCIKRPIATTSAFKCRPEVPQPVILDSTDFQSKMSRLFLGNIASFLGQNLNEANRIAKELSEAEKTNSEKDTTIVEKKQKSEAFHDEALNPTQTINEETANFEIEQSFFGSKIGEVMGALSDKVSGQNRKLLYNTIVFLDPKLKLHLAEPKSNVALRYELQTDGVANLPSSCVDYTQGAGAFQSKDIAAEKERFEQLNKLKNLIQATLRLTALQKPNATAQMSWYLNPKTMASDDALTASDRQKIDRKLEPINVDAMLVESGLEADPKDLFSEEELKTREKNTISHAKIFRYLRVPKNFQLLPEDTKFGNEPITTRLYRNQELTLLSALLEQSEASSAVTREHMIEKFRVFFGSTNGAQKRANEAAKVKMQSSYLVNLKDIRRQHFNKIEDKTQAHLIAPRARFKNSTLDWYLAVGNFTLTINSNLDLVSCDTTGCNFIGRHKFFVFDKYDWHRGLAVTLFDSWCDPAKYWLSKLSGNTNFFIETKVKCDDLEKRTKVQVSDSVLGDLHTFGLAREFELSGFSSERQRAFFVPFTSLSISPETEKSYLSSLQELIYKGQFPSNTISNL